MVALRKIGYVRKPATFRRAGNIKVRKALIREWYGVQK